MKFFTFFAIFCLFFITSDSANILGIFQFPYYSHQKFHQSIIQILVEQGHNLTVFTTHGQNYGDNPNITQHVFTESVKIHDQYTDMLMYKRKKLHWIQYSIQHEVKAYYESAKIEMEHPEMQNLIKNSSDYKFDLIIAECVICSALFLSEIYDCPVVMVSGIDPPCMVHSLFGNDINPFKYSEMITMPYVHGQLKIPDQINSLLFQIFVEFVFKPVLITNMISLQYKHFSHLGTRALTMPTHRLAFLFTNTNQAFGHVRPLMPNTAQIGFLHVEKPKKITDVELKKFLDNSPNGVIITALGSRADPRNLGIENVKKFISAFKQSKMDVLWKLHDIEDELDVPENIKIVSWLPLADVLAHPNVKLLIFHGGLFTSYEAIDRKVPMIAFPLGYDQYANARLLAKNGIAMEMDLNNFDSSSLVSAIQEMKKPKYAVNIRKMRTQAYTQPISNRDLVLWHIENTIKNPKFYSKDFGSVSIFQSPWVHLIVYLLLFIWSVRFVVKKVV